MIKRVQPTCGCILVLDDDAGVRQMLSTILLRVGFEVICCADVRALLDQVRKGEPSCILLDQVLPESSGIMVLEQLRREGCTAPVLMISGKADIPTALQALKQGATDFLEKPFSGADLIARVNASIKAAEDGNGAPDRPTGAFHFPGRPPLTSRERNVLALIADGFSTKEIALQLGLSPRTVESHRQSIMRKFGATKLVELVRMVRSSGGSSA